MQHPSHSQLLQLLTVVAQGLPKHHGQGTDSQTMFVQHRIRPSQDQRRKTGVLPVKNIAYDFIDDLGYDILLQEPGLARLLE